MCARFFAVLVYGGFRHAEPLRMTFLRSVVPTEQGQVREVILLTATYISDPKNTLQTHIYHVRWKTTSQE